MMGFIIATRRKKSKKVKTERQKLVKQLDDLWRILIKQMYGHFDGTYYYCERCGKPCGSGEGAGKGKGINSHHIVGRSNWNTRWDLENGTPLCSGDHTLKKDSAHQDRTVFLQDIIEKRGHEWYIKLLARAGGGLKRWTISEMKLLKVELQNSIQSTQK